MVALGMFTIIPAPFVDAVDATLARRAVLFLPWLGLALGGVSALCGWLVAWRGGGSLLGGIVALVVLAALTGAMHLDGLADTADGLGSRRPAAEALQVMRRSDIGPMGVSSLVLVLLLDAAVLSAPSLASLRWQACALAPMLGRLAVLTATRQGLRGARGQGFGALFAEALGRRAVIGEVALGLAVACGLGWCADGWHAALRVGLGAAASLLVAAGWRTHLIRRLGGLTGDTFGSLVEVTQAAFLLAVVLLG